MVMEGDALFCRTTHPGAFGASADMVVCVCLRSPFCFLNNFFQVDFEHYSLAQLKSGLQDGSSGVFVD